MTRLLHEDEMAVLKAIFDQRAKSQWSSIFVYNPEEAQIFLNSIGAFSAYDLEKDKQYDIINRLTDEEIIKTDYLVDVDFVNNYRLACAPNAELIKSNEKYYWLRGTDWAREAFGPNMVNNIEEVGRKHAGDLVINMSTTDERRIERQYMASRVVRLILVTDGDEYVLRIKFEQEEWHDIYRMNKNKNTAKILYVAFKNAGKVIKTNYKYLESKVFKKNGPVQALNPTLIKLDGNKITFRTVARVAPAEFERLKIALGIA